jgi:hypothetical protein
MTGPKVRQWLADVAMNKTDWYRSISVSVPSASSFDAAAVTPSDWTAFVKGWIHCTTGTDTIIYLLIHPL